MDAPMLKIDLTGKTAIVTGATGQVGRVMARTLAQCGADVVIQIKPQATLLSFCNCHKAAAH